MPINPSIALQFRGPEIESPLNAAAKFAQVQNAQTQNMLVQQQLAKAQREQETVNAFNRAYQGAFDPATGTVDYSKLKGGLVTAGLGSKIPEIEESRVKGKKLEAEAGKAESELVDTKLKQSREFLSTVRTPEQYAAWINASFNDPVIGPVISKFNSREAALKTLQDALQTPGGFDDILRRSSVGVEKFIELNKPQVTSQDLGGRVRMISRPGLGGPATVVPGSEAQKTMGPGEAERIRLEGQRIGLEGRRVAIAEENARRDADPMFQQRLAVARATGEAAAKGDAAAKQALPKIVDRAEQTIDLVDQMIGKQEVRDKSGKVLQAGTKPHSGFQNAVGATWLPGMRFVPGSDAAGFQALFDQVKGGAFLEAFESLKGGGAISNTEGKVATDALNRMSLAQDEKEFVKAAREFQEVVRKGVQRASSKAGAAGGSTPSAGNDVDMSNPLLK